MCLHFCTNCRVCSYPAENNNASRIKSAVSSCSSEVKMIFCVGMWQWMKDGSTTIHLKQKDRQLSGQQLVKATQSDQNLISGLARYPSFGMRMVFCSSTILRKVKPLTETNTWYYWIDRAQKSRKNGLTCKRKKCCSTKTMHCATNP